MINENFFNIFSSNKDISEVFSNLISVSNSDVDSGNQLIYFFETIPDSIKDKEPILFSKCFLKFFNKFPINEKNEKYFLLFNENFSNSELNKIKLKNSINISFEKINDVSFFIKNNPNFDFYTANKNTFFLNDSINLFGKDNFIKNLSSKDSFKILIEKDINEFKEFCTSNNLNYQKIIYTTYFEPNSEKFKKSILSISDENLLTLLTDLSDNQAFKEHFSFFSFIGYNEDLKRDINVLFFSLLLLASDYEKSFNFIINTYEKKISYLMGKFGDEQYDSKNSFDWESFLSSNKMKYYKNALQHGASFPLRYDELEFVLNKFSKEKLSYFLMNNSISKKSDDGYKKPKI